MIMVSADHDSQGGVRQGNSATLVPDDAQAIPNWLAYIPVSATSAGDTTKVADSSATLFGVRHRIRPGDPDDPINALRFE